MNCRLCLINITAKGSLALFEISEVNSERLKLIEKCLQLKIIEEDRISTRICLKCGARLDEFNTFCERIKKQQKTLSTLAMSKNKEVSESEEEEEDDDDDNDPLSSLISSPEQDPLDWQLKCEPEEHCVVDKDPPPIICQPDTAGTENANAAQVKSILEFMQQNPDIAKYDVQSRAGGGGEEDIECLWNELAATLNSKGSPQNDVNKWKEIWRTWRHNVHRKLARNAKMSSAAFDKPRIAYILSHVEQEIAQICDLNAVVEIVSRVKSFGLNDEAEESNASNTSIFGQTSASGSNIEELRIDAGNEWNETNIVAAKDNKNGTERNDVSLGNFCTVMSMENDYLKKQHLVLEKLMQKKNRILKLKLRQRSKRTKITKPL